MSDYFLDKRVVEAEYRWTSAGGMTYPLAFRVSGGRIERLRPISRELSKSGNHGVYRFVDPDVLVILRQSNRSLRRSVRVTCKGGGELCQWITDIATHTWVKLRGDIADVVENILELNTLKPELFKGV